jgi:uncharacterized protein YndB with AHSA1/START domain
MKIIETAVIIPQPANDVFAFFVPQRMPYWYGVEMNCCFELQDGAADFRPGQKVRISGSLGKRPVSLTVVIMQVEWPRALEWRFQDSYGVKGTQRWALEPIPSGTRVRMADSYALPETAGVVGTLAQTLDFLVTRRSIARRNRDALARLARLLSR